MSFNLLKLVESYVVISVQVSGYVMVRVLIFDNQVQPLL